MSLLKLLGIDKYTERLKLWVNNKLDSIKTPDWMAGQNEDGYIKNKTHGLLDVSPLMNNGDTVTVDISSAVIYSPVVGTRYTTINSGETKTIVYLGDSSVTVTFSGNTITLNDPASFLQEPIYVAWSAEQLDDVFIPQTISRIPNWNAKEGESGYIENKPFESHLKANEHYWIYGTGDEVVSEMQMFYYDNYSSDDEIVVYINGEEFVLHNHLRIPVHIGSYIEFNNVSILNGNVDFEVNFYLESMDDYDYGNEYEFKIRVYEHKQISSKFVSDVVKTTPQTLSNDAKNQALDNLGIDPVLWKYMCNPYEIILSDYTSGTAEIPEDLAKVISKNINHSRLTVSLCISGEIYFANGIGNSEYLMFNIPDSDPVYIGFNGKNVYTP